MEKIVLTEMESLLSPVEQAKLVGLIKEPGQIQNKQKSNFILYGMAIAGVCAIIGYFLSERIIKKNKKDKIN